MPEKKCGKQDDDVVLKKNVCIWPLSKMTFQFVLSSLEKGSSLSFGVLNYFFLNTQRKEISSYLRSTSRKRDLWERYSVGAGWEQS